MPSRKKSLQISPPDSMISEQFRSIRTNLYFSSNGRRNQTLLITSAGPSEGKTLTTIHLADSLAQQGERVLVVDASLRKPNLHTIYHVNQEIGLSEYLKGEISLDDAMHLTGRKNVSLITTGAISSNPAELLGSTLMKCFLVKIKTEFDVILIDSPPLIGVTDSILLANQCDGVILVCCCGKTKEKSVLETKRMLEFAKANLLGTVLTNM